VNKKAVISVRDMHEKLHAGEQGGLYEVSNKITFIPDDVVAEILIKARQDTEFNKMLFDDPQKALDQFDVVIPISSGEGYLDTVYAAFERAEFYRLFNLKILNDLRDETLKTAPGASADATGDEDPYWGLEVTLYNKKSGSNGGEKKG
jgi:hypothetical protein